MQLMVYDREEKAAIPAQGIPEIVDLHYLTLQL